MRVLTPAAAYFPLVFGTGFVLGIIRALWSVSEALGNNDPVSGTVYYALLGVFAVMPWLLTRH